MVVPFEEGRQSTSQLGTCPPLRGQVPWVRLFNKARPDGAVSDDLSDRGLFSAPKHPTVLRFQQPEMKKAPRRAPFD